MIHSMIRKFGVEAEVYRDVTTGSGAYPSVSTVKQFQTVGVLDTIRGSKSSQYGQVKAQSTDVFFVFPCDIQTDDTLLVNGNRYNVTYVDNPMNANQFYVVELELVPYGVSIES